MSELCFDDFKDKERVGLCCHLITLGLSLWQVALQAESHRRRNTTVFISGGQAR